MVAGADEKIASQKGNWTLLTTSGSQQRRERALHRSNPEFGNASYLTHPGPLIGVFPHEKT